MSDEVYAHEYNRGWYFPTSLIQLYEEKTISAEGLFLLGKINALCHPEKGCWASNGWLAKWWGKSPQWVSDTLAEFETLGLIEIKVSQREGNRRIIWCLFQPDRLKKKRPTAIEEKTYSYRRKDLQPPSKNSGDTSMPRNRKGGRPLLSITNEYNDIKCPKSARGARSHLGRSDFGMFKGGQEMDPFFTKCSNKLETFIRKSRRIAPNFKRSKWLNEFHLLLQALNGDKYRLKMVLFSYINLPHGPFTPQAECAESFRRKFSQIERWVHQQGVDTFDPEPREEKRANGDVVRYLPSGAIEIEKKNGDTILRQRPL